MGRAGARPVLDRISRRLRATSQIARLEGWFQNGGSIAVFLARLTPGLLTASSVMAGVLRVPYGIFCLNVTASAAMWTGTLFVAGVAAGFGSATVGFATVEGSIRFVPIALVVGLLAALPLLLRRLGFSKCAILLIIDYMPFMSASHSKKIHPDTATRDATRSDHD